MRILHPIREYRKKLQRIVLLAPEVFDAKIERDEQNAKGLRRRKTLIQVSRFHGGNPSHFRPFITSASKWRGKLYSPSKQLLFTTDPHLLSIPHFLPFFNSFFVWVAMVCFFLLRILLGSHCAGPNRSHWKNRRECFFFF